MASACAHIAFCFEMYEIQRKAGRFFAHEHPSSASSWSRPEVLEMLLREDVELVEVDMCNFGMTASDEYGEALVRKRTKILTNSSEVAKRVARKCDNSHRHVHLIGGKAKRAQLYPRAFSRAASLMNCQWYGCTSGARRESLLAPTSSVPHHTLPLGGLGRTRSKTVSPVQAIGTPSSGCRITRASLSCPVQVSSMSSSSGHCAPTPVKVRLVDLWTSM